MRRPPSPSSTPRSQSGVEVGLLLDQLVGYFRDVMTTAVGCPPTRCCTPCRRRPTKWPKIGRQLGLSTILAIGQILDQTAARMRVSMHGRTLVEMAIVRICQLGELDDLASLVAELRGQPANSQTRRPGVESRSDARRPTRPRSPPAEPAKKNAEPPQHATSAGRVAGRRGRRSRSMRVAEPSPANASCTELRTVGRPHARRADKPSIDAHRPTMRQLPTESQVLARLVPRQPSSTIESALAQFQRRDGRRRHAQRPTDAARRRAPSRREQLAQVAEQPFVQPRDGAVRRPARPVALHAARTTDETGSTDCIEVTRVRIGAYDIVFCSRTLVSPW